MLSHPSQEAPYICDNDRAGLFLSIWWDGCAVCKIWEDGNSWTCNVQELRKWLEMVFSVYKLRRWVYSLQEMRRWLKWVCNIQLYIAYAEEGSKLSKTCLCNTWTLPYWLYVQYFFTHKIRCPPSLHPPKPITNRHKLTKASLSASLPNVHQLTNIGTIICIISKFISAY